MYALDARRQERLTRGHVLPWADKYIEERPIVAPEPHESSEDSPYTDSSSEESNEDAGQDLYVPMMNHVIEIDSDSDEELL
jgi:hypothetical protein